MIAIGNLSSTSPLTFGLIEVTVPDFYINVRGAPLLSPFCVHLYLYFRLNSPNSPCLGKHFGDLWTCVRLQLVLGSAECAVVPLQSESLYSTVFLALPTARRRRHDHWRVFQ